MTTLAQRIHETCVAYNTAYGWAATDLFLPPEEHSWAEAQHRHLALERCAIAGPFETYGGMKVHRLAAGERMCVAGRVWREDEKSAFGKDVETRQQTYEMERGNSDE